MEIILISPKDTFYFANPQFAQFWKEHTEASFFFDQNWFGMAYGLLVIAALTPSSFKIELIDENFERIDFSKHYDLVGISTLTSHSCRAYEIADEFRKRKVKVVMGGIHVTVLPDEAKKHADSVVIGEAEYVWPELLEDLIKNKLKPFYKSDRLVDLSDSPMPRYDLIQSKNYKSINIQTARGCPHDCEFCLASNVYGRRYRHKTITQVIHELQAIKQILGNVTISFGDDNLLVKKDFAKELLKKMIPLNIRYYIQSDIAIAEDDELLDLLQKSGCVNIFIGFETVYEEGLENIDKNGWKVRKFKNYSQYIDKIQKKGIGILGSFMIGLDTDDSSIVNKIANFIINNNIFQSQITICTPLPGSRLFARLKKENRLLPISWNNYSMVNLNFVHPILSKEEIENGLTEIWKTVYSPEAYNKKMTYFKEIHKNLIQQRVK